ncbi:uncharacterized protein PRCAT00000325001 [Priceomyces carsonii]|uniref:uncharacterized protein n=1 Tax=Priceomyces carsonii TaxID=28549 RepID=UPI002EDA690B|nr:unnamed protein product [Priceomyces carsonii]
MLHFRLLRTPKGHLGISKPWSPLLKRNISLSPQPVIISMTESLQFIHEYSHIPWWALIPLTTFALRSIWTLPLAIMQRKRIQKQAMLRPVVSATNPVLKLNLAKKVQSAKQKQLVGQNADETRNSENGDSYVPQLPLSSMTYEQILLLSAKETRKRQKKLFKENGVQLWKNIILPACQVPLWIAMSWTFRDLSGWSTWNTFDNRPLDESLYTEGLLWFTDLTIPDSFHLFPLMIGLISLCNVEWTFKTLSILRRTQNTLLRTNMSESIATISRMSVVFLMAISLHAPVALVLYWLSSQTFSLVQNIMMDLTMPMSFTPNRRFNYRKMSAKTNPKSVINT